METEDERLDQASQSQVPGRGLAISRNSLGSFETDELRGRDSSEELADREFDELNEGLMAWQIIEWFERKHPEPEIPEDEVHQPGSLAWDMWEQWQRELVLYADGWKDALKAIEERQELEHMLGEEHRIIARLNRILRMADWWWEEDAWAAWEEFGFLRDVIVPFDIEGEIEPFDIEEELDDLPNNE